MSRVFATQFAGIAVILCLFYWWTGLPEATGAQVAISLAVLVVGLAGLAGLAALGVRGFRPTPAGGIMVWLTALGGFAIALRFAYWIIWWVPGATSFGGQAFSFAIRFGLAYLAVVGAWTMVLRAIASGMPRSSQASTEARP